MQEYLKKAGFGPTYSYVEAEYMFHQSKKGLGCEFFTVFHLEFIHLP